MRFFAFIIFFISILYLPYWVSIFVCVFLAFIYDKYVEAIFLGFLADAIYSSTFGEDVSVSLKYLFIFSAIVLIVEFLKTKLKFYNNKI